MRFKGNKKPPARITGWGIAPCFLHLPRVS
ncbi:hypothetical protein X474_08895 [Dethiosulfatarculus sandiegensis]|uniref:Uncharacterized protein n=1 Tax=Dethiosulfatarculus sandiegensis TaxID=1429043 RepID=A0A0D2J844_9BACT|nr:hypothetical protein X474_08895 [Dethiosulfatarculus sandiegensis]